MKIKKWTVLFLFALASINTKTSDQQTRLQKQREKIARENMFRVRLGLNPLPLPPQHRFNPATSLQAATTATRRFLTNYQLTQLQEQGIVPQGPRRPARLDLSGNLNMQSQASTARRIQPTAIQIQQLQETQIKIEPPSNPNNAAKSPHPDRSEMKKQRKKHEPFDMFAISAFETAEQAQEYDKFMLRQQQRLEQEVQETQDRVKQILKEAKYKFKYGFGEAWVLEYQAKEKITAQKINNSQARIKAVSTQLRKRKPGTTFHFDATGTGSMMITKKLSSKKVER